MRHKILLLFFALMTVSLMASAQSKRLLPFFTISYQRFSLKNQFRQEVLACQMQGTGVGCELVLVQSNDRASLNMEGFVAGNFILSLNRKGAALLGQTSVVGHLGAGSTPGCTSRIGLAGGVGVTACAFSYSGLIRPTPPLSKVFVTPTVMVEGYYRGKELFPVGLRCNWSPSMREVEVDNWPAVRYFNNFGVSLVVQVPLGTNKNN